MRRYRFGRIAAVVAVGFVVAVLVAAVVAWVSRDARFLVPVITRQSDRRLRLVEWYNLLPLVVAGVVQGWALWHLLRGRPVGERAELRWDARLLRIALFASLGLELLPSSLGVPVDLVQVVLVVLLFRVLDRAPLALRLVALIAGLIGPVRRLADDLVGLPLPVDEALTGLGRTPYLVWLVLTLVIQAGDGRWARATVWCGAALTIGLLLRPSFFYVRVDNDVLPLVIVGFPWVLEMFEVVWLARTAHELATRSPDAPARPARTAGVWRWWPLPLVAVLLPLLPVAVNLARGVPVWIGPRGAVDAWFRESFGGILATTWLSLDVLVGLGVSAVLVLVAVLRPTRRLVLGTVAALLLTAAAGVATIATATPPAWSDADYENIWIHPRELTGEGFGISPLWHSAALTASALLLLYLYGARPALRRTYPKVLVSTATVAALILVPASDHAPGPLTEASDCEPNLDPSAPYEPPPELTAEERFVCGVRTSKSLPLAQGMPDRVLITYGRRLCDAYTIDDPSELTRLLGGVEFGYGLAPLLADICPHATATVRAAVEEEERAEQARQADEQRMCDASSHRPRIKPLEATVMEPEWAELSLHAYESEDDPFEDHRLDGPDDADLVASAPGHLALFVGSSPTLCITTETYDRRPPVETKGWTQVVEVGHRSTHGRIVLADYLSDVELPDLAAHGKGHYRIRVHSAWIDWKGETMAGRRLLIMSYPGRGAPITVHHPRESP
ncbi:hypothetical protein LDL08_05810 [Nonomuraea glycinis]|uniref:Uncharacterized protein n=1 Tax=Nonomuraea glycinis TaxID=2047744 RepID=A0A918A3B8_9ACTN|nr:hypothetical protein [Nonomuraea glycinis]MCA2175697.1 hypothetical protein [Nonomuraea glycinis]GGP05204.1 hypothetical protein GCM10012278_23680 [Nonomuraea glycinis]